MVRKFQNTCLENLAIFKGWIVRTLACSNLRELRYCAVANQIQSGKYNPLKQDDINHRGRVKKDLNNSLSIIGAPRMLPKELLDTNGKQMIK